MSMRSHLARSVIFALGSCAPLACGSISFTDFDAGSRAGGDAQIVVDNIGEGGGDGGTSMTPDTGPPCRTRSLPALPNQWPYTRTSTSYETHFAVFLPDRAGCAVPTCHGGSKNVQTNTWNPPISTPLIPPQGATLDPNSVVNAIDGIWARVLPTASQIPPPQDP